MARCRRYDHLCKSLGVTLTVARFAAQDSDEVEPSTNRTSESPHELDDIRVQYHPKSGRPTEIFPFAEFGLQKDSEPPAPDEQPWLPFRSKADFEFSEIALDAAMNQRQVDALIKLFHRCIEMKESFTLQSHKDMASMWDNASEHLTRVRAHYHPICFHTNSTHFTSSDKRLSRYRYVERKPCARSMSGPGLFGNGRWTCLIIQA